MNHNFQFILHDHEQSRRKNKFAIKIFFQPSNEILQNIFADEIFFHFFSLIDWDEETEHWSETVDFFGFIKAN